MTFSSGGSIRDAPKSVRRVWQRASLQRILAARLAIVAREQFGPCRTALRMVAAANLLEVAALTGDAARETMLSALMGGQSLTATKLAYGANERTRKGANRATLFLETRGEPGSFDASPLAGVLHALIGEDVHGVRRAKNMSTADRVFVEDEGMIAQKATRFPPNVVQRGLLKSFKNANDVAQPVDRPRRSIAKPDIARLERESLSINRFEKQLEAIRNEPIRVIRYDVARGGRALLTADLADDHAWRFRVGWKAASALWVKKRASVPGQDSQILNLEVRGLLVGTTAHDVEAARFQLSPIRRFLVGLLNHQCLS
jgi:hypothetical protein